MTDKKPDWIEQGKKKMANLIHPRPTDSCLATRMFDFIDWFANLAEERFNNNHFLECEKCGNLRKIEWFDTCNECEGREKQHLIERIENIVRSDFNVAQVLDELKQLKKEADEG